MRPVSNPAISPQLDGTEAAATANNDDEEPDFFEEAHDLPTYIDHHHQSWVSPCAEDHLSSKVDLFEEKKETRQTGLSRPLCY